VGEISRNERSPGIRMALDKYSALLEVKISDLILMGSRMKENIAGVFKNFENGPKPIKDLLTEWKGLKTLYNSYAASDPNNLATKEKLHNKTIELATSWKTYEIERATAMQVFILLLSNMYMHYNANILTHSNDLLVYLGKLDIPVEIDSVLKQWIDKNMPPPLTNTGVNQPTTSDSKLSVTISTSDSNY